MAWIYVENEMSKMKLPETVIAVSILSGIVKQCPIYITYTNVRE